jgi:hypothetical protein
MRQAEARPLGERLSVAIASENLQCVARLGRTGETLDPLSGPLAGSVCPEHASRDSILPGKSDILYCAVWERGHSLGLLRAHLYWVLGVQGMLATSYPQAKLRGQPERVARPTGAAAHCTLLYIPWCRSTAPR